jgi:hypothetical protein
MVAVTFKDLLELLPCGANLKATGKPPAVTFPKKANPQFIEPELIVEQPIELGRTTVVLLSAPGAVGKSTVASEIAARAEAPLWDLSKFQVGTGTFNGTILETYDFAATGALKRFREGEALLVLDALDEAQVRAGSSNFDTFLAELAAASKTAREKPSLVLLARNETAEWVNLFLEEAGVSVARYSISYFDERRAAAFIDKLLDARCAADGRQAIHRQQREPYSQARNELFALIYQLFSVEPIGAWQDPRVRNFLGYAPVLEALTGYLDVGNYMPLIKELRERTGVPGDPWQFLANIVDRILERETKKLVDAVRPQLASTASRVGWSAWETLYAKDEQLARILCYALKVQPSSAVRIELPQALAAPYDEALKTQLPQHPFLAGRGFANIVFKEYCYAWGLIRGTSSLTKTLREIMGHRENPFLPSKVFGWFTIKLSASGAALLEGQDFGLVYESLSGQGEAWLSINQRDELLRAEIHLAGPDGGDDLTLDLIDTGSGIQLWRSVRDAEVDIACALRLGLPEQRFALGPSVDIHCGELIVVSDTIDVDATDGVTMGAESYSTVVPDLKVRLRNQERGNLAVNWPGVAHPWAPFRADAVRGDARLVDSVQGHVLRKFILMFRRQRRRLRSTLTSSRWSQEEMKERDKLLELALRKGVLQDVVGPRQDTVELTSEYFSLDALVVGKGELSPKARAFVSEFLGAEEAERLLI